MPQFPLPAGAGQVITYQLAAVKPYGMRYKITPETTEKEVNTRRCFQLPGSKEDVVKAQSVFPSIDGFKVREPEPGSERCPEHLRLWAGVLGSWRCSSPSQGCRVGAGTGQDMPLHPGAQGGSLPRPDRGRTPGSFPNPSSRVGTRRSPHERRRFGTARASRCTAAQLPPAPASGSAGCRRGAAREQRGQRAVTEPDTEPDTCPQGESLERPRKNPEPFGGGVCSQGPCYGCMVGCPPGVCPAASRILAPWLCAEATRVLDPAPEPGAGWCKVLYAHRE